MAHTRPTSSPGKVDVFFFFFLSLPIFFFVCVTFHVHLFPYVVYFCDFVRFLLAFFFCRPTFLVFLNITDHWSERSLVRMWFFYFFNFFTWSVGAFYVVNRRFLHCQSAFFTWSVGHITLTRLV